MTRKTDYALLALAVLARETAPPTSARVLADRLGLSTRLLTNILNRLTRNGLVVSARGTKGGYALAKQPTKITLTELIEAVEGPVRLARCCTEAAADGGDVPDVVDVCNIEASCLIREPVRRLQLSLRHFLDQVTLSDLAWNAVTLNSEVVGANGHAERAGADASDRPIVCDTQSNGAEVIA